MCRQQWRQWQKLFFLLLPPAPAARLFLLLDACHNKNISRHQITRGSSRRKEEARRRRRNPKMESLFMMPLLLLLHPSSSSSPSVVSAVRKWNW
jgi:hypothetical protein